MKSENYRTFIDDTIGASNQAVVGDPTPSKGTSVDERKDENGRRGFDPSMNKVTVIDDGVYDEENVNYAGKCNFLCNPESLCHKIIILILMCCMGFGNYFCYDNPGALQSPIMTVMNVSTYEFENLYSFYAWPNVVLPIVGGFLMDRVFGIPLGAVIFATFICLGQGITAIGAFSNSFVLMKISRVIFGIGGESLAVAGNTYASAWFHGNALSLVIGFQLSFARVGSYANFLSVGPIYDYFKEKQQYLETDALGWTFAIAGSLTICSLVTAIILGVLEKRREKIMHQGMEKQEKIRLKDIGRFSASFWLISLICVTYYITIFPFISVAQVLLQEKFGFTTKEAANLQGLPYLFSAVAVPVFGFMLDRTGRNVLFVTIACLITLASHALFAFANIKALAYVAVTLMGIGYSLLASSLWPMIALITPLHRQGTAFGFTQAIQNLGLGLSALLVGFITDKFGYFWLEIFFVICLVVAISACLILWIVDYKQDKYLMMNTSERRLFESTLRYRTMMNMETEYEEI